MKDVKGQVTMSVGRELGQGVVVLALAGSTVGAFLAMVTVATRALGS